MLRPEVSDRLQVLVGVREAPVDPLLVAEFGYVAVCVVALASKLFIVQREASITVLYQVRNRLGAVLVPSCLRLIPDQFDASAIRALCPRRLLRVGERQAVVEVADPVIAEQACGAQ